MKKVLFVLLCIVCFCACNNKKGAQHTYLVNTWDNDTIYVKADYWRWNGTSATFYADGVCQHVSKCKDIIVVE